MRESSERRMLICRLSAVGDCVLTLPVLCALRERFPEARISWLVEPLSAQLLRGHRCLDQLLIAPRGWLKSPSSVFELRRELRKHAFDTVIDAQSLTKSCLAGWLSGARQRIGFAPPQGRELAPWCNNRLVVKTHRHVVDAQLQLLEPLGIERPEVRFELPQSEEAQAGVAPILEDERLRGGFAVLNPGAGWDSKLWPADRYAVVARQLGRRHQLPSLVVWAGPREQQWAEQIQQAADGHAIMAPRTSLSELVELLRAARLFVGSDTGPLHMAAAVGTPCVAIFGPTEPEVCGPYGQGHATLQAWYQGGTSRERRAAENRAMRAVLAEPVVAACQRVLDRHPRVVPDTDPAETTSKSPVPQRRAG